MLNEINWAESAWRASFFALAVVLVYAIYHGIKFFGSRFLKIIDRLTDLSDKMDARIVILESEQKLNIERFNSHDEKFDHQQKHIDMLISTLISATKR